MSKLHDKTKLYPTNEDINGKENTAMKNVTYADIKKEIEVIEAKLKPDQAKMNSIYDRLNKAVANFAVAVGESDSEKVESLAAEIEDLHKQERMQKSLNWATEHGQLEDAIKNNSKIREMANQFEKENVEYLKTRMSDREKSIEKFRETRKEFLKATYELGLYNYELGIKCGELEGTRAYNPSPVSNVRYDCQFPLLHFAELDVLSKQKSAWYAGSNNLDFEEIVMPKTATEEAALYE